MGKQEQHLELLLKYGVKCTLCDEPIDLSDRGSYQVDCSDEGGLGRFYFHTVCLDD